MSMISAHRCAALEVSERMSQVTSDLAPHAATSIELARFKGESGALSWDQWILQLWIPDRVPELNTVVMFCPFCGERLAK